MLAFFSRPRPMQIATSLSRYDPAFERAIVYLRTSEKEYTAEEENKIMLQKRQMKRTRIVATILGGAAIISVGFMLFAFVQKIQADKATEQAKINAQKEAIQRHIADSSSVVAKRQSILADSSATVAKDREKEALRQKELADSAKLVAIQSEKNALIQKGIAVVQSDSATQARNRAVISEQDAIKQKNEADRRKVLAVSKSMSIKSLQVEGQKDLQTLLAYQAYLFNKSKGGEPNDADIYMGLYNVAKQYGNVNYKTFVGDSGAVKSIAFIPGKREFFTSSEDRKIIRWNLDSKDQNLQVIYSGPDVVEVLAVSPDAGWLACGGLNSVIKMIPISGGNNKQYELKGHTGKIKSLVFSYDGKYLYSASLDGKVLKWDLAAKTSVNISSGGMQIISIDISSNGNYLAGVSTDGKVLVWNPEKTTDTFMPDPGGKVINTVRFKPGENTLALGYTDGNVELWDISSHKKISVIKAHSAKVNDIQFNNKNFQMATASGDKTLKIWDTRDLTIPPINFSDNGNFVMVIGFSPDGQLIISGTYENTNNLVGRPTLADILAQDVCSMLSRNLSSDEWATYVAKDIEYEKTCPDKDLNKDLNIKVNVIR